MYNRIDSEQNQNFIKLQIEEKLSVINDCTIRSVLNYTKFQSNQIQIKKGDLDKCDYRYLELENGLKALLISDSTTDKGAAAMDVAVGFGCDPENFQGLAHFLEHMLFMGTKKYPEENEYSKFLSEHGGSYNAFTADSHTNFFFDISHDNLKEALDRFSRFFYEPLFSKAATEREIKAVHSEHQKNLQNDSWRVDMVGRSLCIPSHPYCKFGTGCLSTLDKPEIRDQLLSFHKQHYHAHKMCLVIVGRETLDQLEQFAIEYFNHISTKPEIKDSIQKIEQKDSFFAIPEKHSQVIHIKTIEDRPSIKLQWSLPDQRSHYKTKPLSYVSHCLGHEGPTSLLSLLKSKGLATSLSAYSEVDNSFSFFHIDIALTGNGVEKVNEMVVPLVFYYIRSILKLDPDIWRESSMIATINFRWKEQLPAFQRVSSIASNMQKYFPEDILSGPIIFSDIPDEDALVEILQILSKPLHFRYFLLSKSWDSPLHDKEIWYGTEYSVNSFNVNDLEKRIHDLVSNEAFSQLKMPSRNQYIPTSFKVNHFSAVNSDSFHSPTPLILDTLWYKADQHFNTPKTTIALILRSDFISLSPINYNIAQLWCLWVNDQLDEMLYDVTLTGTSFSISITDEQGHGGGVLLRFYGFDEILLKLAQSIVLFLKTFIEEEPLTINQPIPVENVLENQTRFDSLLEKYKRSLANWHFSPPWKLALSSCREWLSPQKWPKSDLEHSLNNDAITLSDLRRATKHLIFSSKPDFFIHGNFTEESAKDFVKTIVELLSPLNIPHPTQTSPAKIVNLHSFSTDANSQLIHLADPCVDNNFATVFYLQISKGNLLDIALSDLFIQIFNEPFFDQLRTKEQLGYMVWHFRDDLQGVTGLYFIIQSPSKDPVFLDSRIENFIETRVKSTLYDSDSPLFLQEMDLERHKQALISILLTKEESLPEESDKYWPEMTKQLFRFNQFKLEAEIVRTLTLQELRLFVSKFILKESLHRAKLSVHQWNLSSFNASKLQNYPEYCENENKLLKYENRALFFTKCSLYQ